MDPFADHWGVDPLYEPEVSLEGLDELGLFGIKLPKIKIGLPKITIRNKWLKRAIIGGSALVSGGVLPYLARQGAIPGVKLSEKDKKMINNFYKEQAVAGAIVAGALAAPALLSAAGTAVSATGGMALKAGSALVKGAKAAGVDKAIAEGLKKGWKHEKTKSGKGRTVQQSHNVQTLNIRPPEPTARQPKLNWIPWAVAGLVLYLWSKQ